MADVICDTSFLIHLATRRIRNIDRLNQEIGGDVSFVVPYVVLDELRHISEHNDTKRIDAQQTLLFVKKFKTMRIICKSDIINADDAIISHATKHKGMLIVATMDRQLKRKLREYGCTIMSFSNDRIVLE